MLESVEILDRAANDFGFREQRLPRFVSIRVHSWLKRKPQHFDRGGDFDVLVADDEI